MGRLKKEAAVVEPEAPAPVPTVPGAPIPFLIGKFFVAPGRLGQIVAQIGDSSYFIHLFDDSGVRLPGYRLWDLYSDEADSSIFFDSLGEAMKNKASRAVSSSTMTVPSMTAGGVPVKPIGPIFDDKVGFAIANIKPLIGKHGILGVVPAQLAPEGKPRVIVEVDGDATDARVAIPPLLYGVEVEVMFAETNRTSSDASLASVKPVPEKPPEKPTAAPVKPAESEDDDTPY